MEAQRSKEWFQKRKSRITGSIAGACLGVNPWMKPGEAMRSLVRDALNAEREFTGNIATEYGVRNEDHAIKCLEIDHDLEVKETGFHTYEDWLGASPDGLIGDDTVLEIKTPYGLRNGGEFKALREQPYYYAQVQLEMLCTGRIKAIFYQWAPHAQKIEYINLDHEWLSINLPKLSVFHQQFLNELKNPKKYLEPKVKTVRCDLFQSLVEERKELLEHAKRLKEVESQIKQFAEHEGTDLEGFGVKVSKVVKKGNVDYKSIPALKGLDLEEYHKPPSEYWMIKNV